MTDPGHNLRRTRGRYAAYTRSRLAQFARRLERRIYPERRAVDSMEIAGPTDRIGHAAAQALDYRPARLGETLGPPWSTHWVRVSARIPDPWAGARVDLYWDSRSEALLRRSNGETVQGLNIDRHTATLAEQAVGGETVAFDLEVACNRSFGVEDQYGRGPGEPYRLAACEIRRFDPEAWALFHDFDVLRQLEADREPPPEPRGRAEDRPPRARHHLGGPAAA